MALTSEQITAQNFKDFYGQIYPYLNGAAHAGFTPVGTVISVMGNSAPQNYLACDGTAYNITDYPVLANYFTEQFGSANFFGGDGTTTFAVPDLRGEFLRGTGTNSHSGQGSGSSVGVHQNGTGHAYIYGTQNGAVSACPSSGALSPQNMDAVSNYVYRYFAISGSVKTDINMAQRYNSRPTNTSVLYCIATHDIYVDARFDYSTTEKVVGTWIDGKTLYQRTYALNVTAAGNTGTKLLSGLSDYVITSALGTCTYDIDGNKIQIPNNLCNLAVTTSGDLYFSSTYSSTASEFYITLQYTKTTD